MLIYAICYVEDTQIRIADEYVTHPIGYNADSTVQSGYNHVAYAQPSSRDTSNINTCRFR